MLVECAVCQAIVDGAEHGSYTFEERHEGEPIGLYVKLHLLSCPRCQAPAVAFEESDWQGGPWGYGGRVFPADDKRLGSEIPEPIRVAHEEARRCFKARAYTATAIMCRKTLEGICVEHGVKVGNLKSALDGLQKQRIIEGRLFEWADNLRLVGNDAVHDVGVTVSAEDARDVLDFTEALIGYVFTLRDKFEAYKARKGAAIGASATT